MKNLYIFLLLLVGLGGFGQKTVFSSPCATDEVYKALEKKDPSLKERMERMNKEMWDSKTSNNNIANRSPQTSFTIPVIVYVVHNNQPLGVGANITDAQVQSQIAALNTYFTGSGINFCLATKFGNQNLLQAAGNLATATSTTPGIIHVNDAAIAAHTTTPSSQQALVGGTSGYSLSNDKYLKIWVVQSIDGSGTSGIQGYSYFPNAAAPLDGIVMNYRVFGDNTPASTYSLTLNYQQGKILAHEAGHYLGLKHTFEGGCHDTSGFNSQTLGDNVVDTPPVKQPNQGCPTNVDSCPADGLPDDISNYMDYTFDTCKNHFSNGQRDRVLFYLNNYRSNLFDVDNLIFTGVCNSNNLISSKFTGSLNNTNYDYIYNICAGSTMYFKPNTPSTSYTSGPVTYLWDFGNGLTSTLENPSTNYNLSSNNFFTVQLTVTFNGNSSISTKNIFVNNCLPIVNNESTWYHSSKNILRFYSGVPRTDGTIVFPGDGIFSANDYSDNTFEGVCLQNDDFGNVLFFSDNKDVFNGLNPASKINNNPLFGCTWGSPQSNIILKSPLNNNQYFIIHKLGIPNTNYFFSEPFGGLRYSIVNVNNNVATMSSTTNISISPTLNQNNYIVSSFDGSFTGYGALQVVEKITGGYWIITSILANNGLVYLGVFDFNINGSITLKNIYLLPDDNWQTTFANSDVLNIAPNGDKLFYRLGVDNGIILDFDKFEGILTKTTLFNTQLGYKVKSGFFSTNSKLMYSEYGQLDIDSQIININNTFNNINATSYAYGPDKKIYFTSLQNNRFNVLHRPNEKATPFNPNSFKMQEDIIKPVFSLPNGFTYRYLPNFIHSKKETAYTVNQISAYKAGCGSYKFFPDVTTSSTTPVFLWNFGDPTSGAANNTSSLNTPTHVFSGSGTYTVSLTYNGNTTITTQVTITTFTPPLIQGSDSQCVVNNTATTFNSVALLDGQTVVWSVLSGTGAILTNNLSEVQINWSQLPGIVQAVITDSSGCIGTVTKTITVLPTVTPTFTIPVTSFCSGTNVPSLPTLSNNNITGSWVPSAVSNTTTRSYVFTPNTNACAVPVTVNITILPTNDPSCTTNPCLPNLTLNVPETNSTIIYKRLNWIEANTNYTTVVGQNITMKAGNYVNLKPGTHIKSGSNLLGKIEACTATSKISLQRGINPENAKEDSFSKSLISIFPNPTRESITIASSETNIKSIVISTIDGKTCFIKNDVNNLQFNLDVNTYQNGIYIVIIETTDGNIAREKLIKN